jgi:3D (Asp-Asp-Asp) domain-containing protein
MSKPLVGGSVAAAALLSSWLFFTAQPLVAEPLAVASQELQAEQKGDAHTSQAPGVEDEKGNSNAAERAKESTPATDAQPAEAPQHFTATAYSLRGRTASGQGVRRGLIAADRRVLPIGTRVRLEAGSYSGEYVVADTGGAVRGRKIDIWMPSTGEAMRFGRRTVRLTVLTRPRARAAAHTRGR